MNTANVISIMIFKYLEYNGKNSIMEKLARQSLLSLHKKFSNNDFFIKCDQIHSFPRIWSH